MPSFLSLFVFFCCAVVYVSAHGNLQEIVTHSPFAIYTAYLPYTDPYQNPPPQRIERAIPGNGPVQDVTSDQIRCNGGGPAALVAKVDAGSQITFNETVWPTSHTGPIMVNMARAPSDITKWEPGHAAVWFNIFQAGKGQDGKWVTDEFDAAGSVYTVTIPSNLAPGQYLMQWNIIALHSTGAPQFYPNCIQVEVSGNGNYQPTNLVSFPGAYNANDPGLMFNIYTDKSPYPIPGPKTDSGLVFSGGSSAGGGSSGGSSQGGSQNQNQGGGSSGGSSQGGGQNQNQGGGSSGYSNQGGGQNNQNQAGQGC